MTLTSRAAVPDDAPAIAAIYNQGIEDRVGTFETEPRSPEAVAAWLDGRHPIVVVVDAAGAIVAFGATYPYSARACYAGIAEGSVYVDRAWRRKGAGSVVMQALMPALEQAGFWKLTSRVFVENAASRALLQRFGFREVGVLQNHAKLDGVWRDVVLVERLIPRTL
ncbi:arsinothricin resistance N-acetyltransferase ArsN1 family A [Caulobacter sp. 17J65-9]|uniref:arsinothricin resistance N-acetyltransferase ArsN1 family A n=1 Tax=Caulobacter sp. 17J65-9 TaxID=2709382 RepID=UPI0013C58AC9|nr:N-acetyltransferase [Caulobacter sp. 17J65-9]